MNRNQSDSSAATQTKWMAAPSAELHNDRTQDSTVDTDGKNREAARLAGDGPIGPDEVVTSNATHVNSVPEAGDGIAGFDSRQGGNHLLVALEPGYVLVEKGMHQPVLDLDDLFDSPRPGEQQRHRGRFHYALNHRRPNRIIEFQRIG
jgi:Protein of unknown function (DUF3005)